MIEVRSSPTAALGITFPGLQAMMERFRTAARKMRMPSTLLVEQALSCIPKKEQVEASLISM